MSDYKGNFRCSCNHLPKKVKEAGEVHFNNIRILPNLSKISSFQHEINIKSLIGCLFHSLFIVQSLHTRDVIDIDTAQRTSSEAQVLSSHGKLGATRMDNAVLDHHSMPRGQSRTI